MTKSPAFQFYPKDWLSSRRILMMTPAQEGAYTRLLAYCWDSGDCSLPDNDQELAVLSRLGEGWLNGASTLVRKCFIPHPSKPGYLTNERLLEEAAKQGAWKQKSSEGGKKSAAKRAEKKANSKGGYKVVEPNHNRTLQLIGNIASASSSAIDSDTEVSSSSPDPIPIKMPFVDIPMSWKEWAIVKKGWDDEIVSIIWSGFRDYWQIGKGRNTKRKDWKASWQTWCLKENINSRGNGNANNRNGNGRGGETGIQGRSPTIIGGDRQPASKWQIAGARVLDKIERGEI